MAKKKTSNKQSETKWETEFLKTGAGTLFVVNFVLAIGLIIAQIAGGFINLDSAAQVALSVIETFFVTVAITILFTAYFYNGPSRKDIKKK